MAFNSCPELFIFTESVALPLEMENLNTLGLCDCALAYLLQNLVCLFSEHQVSQHERDSYDSCDRGGKTRQTTDVSVAP